MINWIASSSVIILAVVLIRALARGRIPARAIYALWLLAAAVCFAASILLFWKVRKEERAQRHRHRRQKG